MDSPSPLVIHERPRVILVLPCSRLPLLLLPLLLASSFLCSARFFAETMYKRTEGTRAAKGTSQEPSVARMTGRWERSSFEAVDLDALVADWVVVEGAARIHGEEEVPAPC